MRIYIRILQGLTVSNNDFCLSVLTTPPPTADTTQAPSAAETLKELLDNQKNVDGTRRPWVLVNANTGEVRGYGIASTENHFNRFIRAKSLIVNKITKSIIFSR